MKKTGYLPLLVGLTVLTASLQGAIAPVDVQLQNATATFSQTEAGDFSAARMIDGAYDNRGWSIYPQTTNQTAVFETTSNVGWTEGTLLNVRIIQDHTSTAVDQQHTLGRFRISVTEDDRSDFADGLQTGGDVAANWRVAEPTSFVSENGATLTLLEDKSILVSGISPDQDVYEISVITTATNITGIRLEALTHESLPKYGPGRQPVYRNYCITELEVRAEPIPADCLPVFPGLVGWWAGDHSGEDLTGYANHATYENVLFGEGKVGAAFEVNGSTSNITIPEAEALAVRSLTFVSWIFPTSITLSPLIEYGGSATEYAGPHFWVGTTIGAASPGALYANMRSGPTEEHVIQVPGVVVENEWQLVAVTYDYESGMARLYVNGEVVQEQSLGQVIPDTAGKPIHIAQRVENIGGSGGQRYAGQIDEFQIFNRALTTEEIRSIYLAGSVGQCKEPPSACVQSPEGLVGWWSGDGHSQDLTGNQNHGVLEYGNYTNAVVGQGFHLSGYQSGLIIPSSPVLAVTNLTWDAWVFPFHDGPMPVIEYGNDDEYAGAHMWVGARAFGADVGALYVNLREGPHDNYIIEAKDVIQANEWNYVAVTYDQASGVAQLFVNGEIVQESNFGEITPRTDKRLNIGQRPPTSADGSAGSYFIGFMDEVGVYNRALSIEELQSLYAAGAGGKCKPLPPGCVPAGLVGWWSGDKHLGDLSGNQPDATATAINFVPGHNGMAMHFDGVNSSVVIPASDSLAVESLSFDAWIYPRDHAQRPILEYSDENDWAGAQFWIGTHGEGTRGWNEPGALFGNLRVGTQNHIIQVDDVIATNEWTFVALTYDHVSGLGRLYVNGELVKEEHLGSFAPDTFGQLNIGSRPLSSSDAGQGIRFAGVLDEVEIFNRALTAEEIQGIYENGKCKVELPLVSIEFVPESGDPAWPDEDYAPGLVEVRRTGDTSAELVVHYAVSGTATAGVDYVDLPEVVTIPAGEEAVQFPVEALDDELSEGAETVLLSLTRQLPDANYYIDSTLGSAQVTIVDNEPAPVERVVLALQVVDSGAFEPSGFQPDQGVILVRRVSGPLNVPVTAQISLGGTAQNGVDYETLQETVELPAGAGHAQIVVRPLADGLAEMPETVTVTLLEPSCEEGNQDPACYVIGTPSAGQVVIRDPMGGVHPPVVNVVKPVNGSVFLQGQVVQIEAQASDADGFIRRLDILVDGQPVGMTNSNALRVNWAAIPGEHAISARALDDRNLVSVSPVVRILVREFHGQAFVTRDLPAGYMPGVAFTVSLSAEPSFGSNAYAIEDEPPAGWEVTAVSHGGVFDSANGKVKFGPFTDDRTRVLSYQVRPPAEAMGTQEFSGVGSIDGQAYPVAGDRVVNTAPSYHPADTNEDYRIELLELTAYASAWKEGEQSIPLSYLTRAALLWRSGEAYVFNGAAGVPPFCWVPAGPQIAEAAVGSGGQAERSFSGTPTAGGSLTVTVVVTPPSGASGYAVEELIPAGWVVASISHEGQFDTEAGVIRWGLFMDAESRSLSYTLIAPEEISSGAVLEGEVSFDGTVVDVTGAAAVGVDAGAGAEVWFESIETTEEGDVLVRISGAPGQICVLETSSDLAVWAELATTFLPDGTLEYLDEEAQAGNHRYYRVRLSN